MPMPHLGGRPIRGATPRLNWTRLTILTWLTLLAATLPLSARHLAAPPAEPVGRDGQPAPASTVLPEADGGKPASRVFESAPNSDAWHAGAIGQVVPSAELSALASAADQHAILRPARDQYSVPAGQCPAPKSLRAMLICLYPHAPPAR